MKICIVVSYTYPYIGSGIGNVALKQAEELAKRGHEVTLISSNFPKYKNLFVRNKVKYLKGKVLLRMEKIGLPIPLFFLDKKMKEAIRGSDIVHIHDSLYPSSYQVVRFAKKHGKKIILTQHIGWIQYKSIIARVIEDLVYHTMSKSVLKNSDKIIILNQDVKNYLIKLGVEKDKLNFIKNGTDIKLFKPVSEKNKKELRKKYNLPLNKPIILFVGRLVEKKGFDKLFEARDKSYFIIFVGGGKIPEKMEKDSNVKFMGAIPQEKLAEIYQLSDLFVLPSHGEGFPLSIQEAMASGLPVITSNDPSYHKQLDKREVKLINPNAEHIRKAIKEVLNNPNKTKKMIKNSRDKAIKGFSWEKNIENLLEVYRG